MYVADTITIFTEAFRALLASTGGIAVEEDLAPQPVLISPEFPMTSLRFPAIWVNFAQSGDVHNAGIGHHEDTEDGYRYYRWTFQGSVEISIVSMGNLERARITDWVILQMAIARPDENIEGIFRKHVTENNLVGLSPVWESLNLGGFSEEPGTPWQTDDVVYLCTVTMDLMGEVVIDPKTGELVPLEAVRIYERTGVEPDTHPDTPVSDRPLTNWR